MTAGCACCAVPSATYIVTLSPVYDSVTTDAGVCGYPCTSSVSCPAPVRPCASATVKGTTHRPPTGLGPAGHVASTCDPAPIVTVATAHDTAAPPPTETRRRPEPALPPNGSYSPLTPVTVTAHVAALLTSHCAENVAPRGASGGATPTMSVIAAERPP